jgi:hypothetical protein
MKRYGGINRFYFDSDFIYNDPASVYTNTIIIPREIAFVEHYSWISSDPRTKIKIGYQNKRYIGPNGDFPVQARCSFSWDEEKNKLIFNPSFWSFYNMQIPVLKKEMEVYTFELKVDFNREENRIDIINHSLEGNHLFLIKDFNGAEYGSYEIYLSKGISYWINPTGDLNLDKTPLCEGISVEIFRGEEKLHHERFYLKIK